MPFRSILASQPLNRHTASMQNRLSLGICIPSIRTLQISSFLRKWEPFWSRCDQQKYRIKIFIHEDSPEPTFELTQSSNLEIVHTSHSDVPRVLGQSAWIIPAESGACRSFPMYLAWKAGCDYIFTLDDDCYPLENGGACFLDSHLDSFNLDLWFRTTSGQESRGVPYGDKGHLPVLLNHGLWTGHPDLDAPTSLTRDRNPVKIVLRASREVIPPGMFFPLCAMNVCYSRQAIPAAYNLIMGMDKAGFDRFDDIWSGLLLKRIADHLGLYITNGVPFVHHQIASSPFSNLRKEALGIQLHEDFWRHIAAAQLDGTSSSIKSCYRQLASTVRGFPQEFPSAPCPEGYFDRLADAMLCWLDLFDSSDELQTRNVHP